MCAEAAKCAFALVRDAMGSEVNDTVGTVIVATVEGDVHDIGKNIVRTLLENYRFHVVDLGKDVPAHLIVEATQKYNAKLVGLSVLMTTTVVNMEKTMTNPAASSGVSSFCKVRIVCGFNTLVYKIFYWYETAPEGRGIKPACE
jgi:cobalamin-dependent methionine synthase I